MVIGGLSLFKEKQNMLHFLQIRMSVGFLCYIFQTLLIDVTMIPPLLYKVPRRSDDPRSSTWCSLGKF